MESYRLRVNGRETNVLAEPNDTLLSVLRGQLQLTGAKCGCGTGDCGACTVIVNGEAVRACVVPMRQAAGAAVETIEGLSHGGRLHPIQQAFVECGAIQCGFCTPGMIMAAKALLMRHPDPDEAAIRAAIAPNLCRCTGYVRIVEAIERAAALMREAGV